ncbi:uncharacterized protein N7503_001266 [Penicillium pulvis]|uniref:uncharacterized protein n=1 Tax=Penicillium pulvis TaxID=1562058 RepID=UPI002547A7F0|nr:uncharacterized protein N7503_001266 [Penicillium pulvis]KAJ5809048.1 hypothetical protein N7503_001266 [Penicillium pulvis]
MRFSNMAGLLAGVTAVSAANSSCAPSSGDATVLEFAWGISDFLSGFYNNTVNSTFSPTSSNASIVAFQQVLLGVEKDNQLGIQAIEKVGAKAPGFTAPQCSYTYPTISSPSIWALWSYRFETTITGAFIGLAGYTQSPEVSFLLARLAAEHSAHATLIGLRVNSTLFASNVTSLVSAYGPNQVLSSSNSTGSLGQYLGGCLQAPTSPCGTEQIGPLVATITPSGSGSSSALASSTPLSSSGSSSTATSSSTASSSTST